MTCPVPRILCVDSSARRLHELKGALEKAGYEVWTAGGASDAVCLASGLRFDVVAVDHASTRARAELWDCLADLHPELPILVHSGMSRMSTLCRYSQVVSSGTSHDPEVVLALLLLLLGNHYSSPAHSPELAAA